MDLQGISSFCGSLNLPGLEKIEYAPVDWLDLDAYEEVISSSNNFQKALTFKTGDWLTAPVFPIRQEWKESPSGSKQGTAYQQTVQATVPKLRPAVSGEFALMADRPFVLKLTDADGQPWLIGTPEHGLLFGAPAQTGESLGDLNDYKIAWNGLTARRAFGYLPVF